MSFCKTTTTIGLLLFILSPVTLLGFEVVLNLSAPSQTHENATLKLSTGEVIIFDVTQHITFNLITTDPELATLEYKNSKKIFFVDAKNMQLKWDNIAGISIKSPSKLNVDYARIIKNIKIYDDEIIRLKTQLQQADATKILVIHYTLQLATEAKELAIFYEIKKLPSSYLAIHFILNHAKRKNLQVAPSRLFSLLSFCDTVQKKFNNYTICKKIIDTYYYKMQKNDTIYATYLPDIAGEIHNLKSICETKKYTYIDFWDSNCPPCRKANKESVALYKKYYDDVNFISISRDNIKANWLSASIADGICWTNLCDLKGKNSLVFSSFDAFSLPKGVLINQSGVIVEADFHPSYLSEILNSYLNIGK